VYNVWRPLVILMQCCASFGLWWPRVGTCFLFWLDSASGKSTRSPPFLCQSLRSRVRSTSVMRDYVPEHSPTRWLSVPLAFDPDFCAVIHNLINEATGSPLPYLGPSWWQDCETWHRRSSAYPYPVCGSEMNLSILFRAQGSARCRISV